MWNFGLLYIVLQIRGVKCQVFHVFLPEMSTYSQSYLKEGIFPLKELYNFKCVEFMKNRSFLFKKYSSF